MKLRPLDVTTCARCQVKVSIIQVNGLAVLVEPMSATTETTIMFQRHRCAGEASPVPPAQSNGYRRR